MKSFALFLAFSFIVFSCGSSKNVVAKSSGKKVVVKNASLKNIESNYSGKNSSAINKILKDAEKYIGVPYKYAGNTSDGFDCSGLVCKVFIENDKKIARRSSDQALEGKEINNKEIRPGDLVFFATSGGTKVSHVGIVHTINSDGEITFIHASTSKGVMISSLNNKYWNKAYLFARRVL
ncbi:C40 family peptidase [Frigoriflavimonas asaccharolytica]|uniref:Cell wall-associated NlpC family hydrolase n=1 Tax=Frigoriflavimonas asaccharolytica TaxID=2735899 RepID=A0A8J8G4U1_9FLAO|nr:C40 family peptidase [Frigoriflavimonas asaccharolytica]NRS91468.1 cell wall-associated NlpC family hydrolase [Frigoriflavimonas asaccharolytica]